MKKQGFQFAKLKGQSYFKCAGRGWETGFVLNNGTVFIGNFVRMRDAAHWYKILNRSIETFQRKYTLQDSMPLDWYRSFLGRHLQKIYFEFLDRLSNQRTRDVGRALNRDQRRFEALKKTRASKSRRARSPYYEAA